MNKRQDILVFFLLLYYVILFIIGDVMKNKKLVVAIAILFSILVLFGGSFCIYKYIIKDNDKTSLKDNNKEKNEESDLPTEVYVEQGVNSYNDSPVALTDKPIFSNDISDLYWGDLSVQKEPKKLLVLLFYYSGTPYLDPDASAHNEKVWGDYIFGSGTIKDGTASVNDYFKEISNGEFYFEPVLLGDNTTGIYTVKLDKAYSDAQFIHEDYPFFDFDVDIATAIDGLVEQGLDISSFTAPNINNSNYYDIMINLWDANQSQHLKGWYMTDKILCVFPPVNLESVSFTPISTDYDHFNMFAHVNADSSFGTIVHELIHTLGAVDIYNFGDFGGDIMSSYYPDVNSDFNSMHVNPYYKLLYGWADAQVLTNSASVTLYPATSDKYNPVIVKTKDNGQYFILENRSTDGFDHGTYIDGSDTVNIWRVDKLGMEAIYDVNRKGIIAELLTSPGHGKEMKYYKNFTDIKDVTLETTGIKFEYVKKNDDGSIVVNVYQ